MLPVSPSLLCELSRQISVLRERITALERTSSGTQRDVQALHEEVERRVGTVREALQHALSKAPGSGGAAVSPGAFADELASVKALCTRAMEEFRAKSPELLLMQRGRRGARSSSHDDGGGDDHDDKDDDNNDAGDAAAGERGNEQLRLACAVDARFKAMESRFRAELSRVQHAVDDNGDDDARAQRQMDEQHARFQNALDALRDDTTAALNDAVAEARREHRGDVDALKAQMSAAEQRQAEQVSKAAAEAAQAAEQCRAMEAEQQQRLQEAMNGAAKADANLPTSATPREAGERASAYDVAVEALRAVAGLQQNLDAATHGTEDALLAMRSANESLFHRLRELEWQHQQRQRHDERHRTARGSAGAADGMAATTTTTVAAAEAREEDMEEKNKRKAVKTLQARIRRLEMTIAAADARDRRGPRRSERGRVRRVVHEGTDENDSGGDTGDESSSSLLASEDGSDDDDDDEKEEYDDGDDGDARPSEHRHRRRRRQQRQPRPNQRPAERGHSQRNRLRQQDGIVAEDARDTSGGARAAWTSRDAQARLEALARRVAVLEQHPKQRQQQPQQQQLQRMEAMMRAMQEQMTARDAKIAVLEHRLDAWQDTATTQPRTRRACRREAEPARRDDDADKHTDDIDSSVDGSSSTSDDDDDDDDGNAAEPDSHESETRHRADRASRIQQCESLVHRAVQASERDMQRLEQRVNAGDAAVYEWTQGQLERVAGRLSGAEAAVREMRDEIEDVHRRYAHVAAVQLSRAALNTSLAACGRRRQRRRNDHGRNDDEEEEEEGGGGDGDGGDGGNGRNDDGDDHGDDYGHGSWVDMETRVNRLFPRHAGAPPSTAAVAAVAAAAAPRRRH